MHAGDIPEPEGRVTTETVGDLFDAIVSDPVTVPPTATLRDALVAILESGQTRKAYVVDPDRTLKGTITIETLMRHVAYRIGARPAGVASWFRFIRDMESDVVTTFMAKPATVDRTTPIVELVRRVVEARLNDFPVVDREGRLIGEVNTYHLLKATRGAFSRSGDSGRGP